MKKKLEDIINIYFVLHLFNIVCSKQNPLSSL